ncbi:hypothetical protein IDJ77_11270 [Mucilaginibacter sp. ZT4R22]|uniref:Uncharacterized protein n=1 Tax=Mucilaginibacter pankratovii TaxID=2772110 RepID=A0ABR7WPY6_9SPHI|nr:hypothetical protein [Mucilaginibacter pankratovii]MBD1364389.1 hypothetical protein [Mucilaginibacter pankratovii]
MEDNAENKPAATVTMFGHQYDYCETYTGDTDELKAYEASWKKAGHKTARKKNKQDPALIDLYVKQKQG